MTDEELQEMIDEADRATGLTGDGPHRSSGETVAGDHPERGFDDLFPSLLSVGVSGHTKELAYQSICNHSGD